MRTELNAGFFEALRADGAASGGMSLYDRLLGDWSVDVVDHLAAGQRRARGEVHFAWVLEGRAIQDVWIVPERAARDQRLSKERNRYGTTLRVFDPETGVWNVTWINPVSGAINQLVGQARGDDIVQEGFRPDGSRIRWSFRAITPDSFHWRGEVSLDQGATWLLETEFHGHRDR